ncbi:MAG TPA: methionine adenosyltransferase [Candidatus Paceibacterota bacterium]
MFFKTDHTYTVESVTSGHPDKVCDQISDTILDACLTEDSTSRVAVETFGGHHLLVIGGEITSTARPNYEAIGRKVYKDIGYTDELKVIVNVAEQSPDISQGVDTGGAGDQGIMYGYATNETKEYLPWALVKVHELTRGLERLRRNGTLPFLMPDGKSQISMLEGKVSAVLVSTQHKAEVSQEEIKAGLVKHLIGPVIGDLSGVEILVNPTGKFVIGGFDGDTGLTGRKIMVDTYGGLAPNGGGAFSGKDTTKVDRSAAYMCRFVAKNLVANGYAKECIVSVSYAIGRAEPLMIEAINEEGKSMADLVKKNFDFRPKAMIERLDLRKPMFRETAAYGHFGREGLPWEEIIKI